MKPFVVSMKGKPLMPCSERKARILLKEGKAKIFQRHPFTIQLLYPTGENVQPVSIGVDTGAAHIGIAVVSEDKVLNKTQIDLRTDVHSKITARKICRRSRRNRKTRYRKARFLNRTGSKKKGWLPPSIQSRTIASARGLTVCPCSARSRASYRSREI